MRDRDSAVAQPGSGRDRRAKYSALWARSFWPFLLLKPFVVVLALLCGAAATTASARVIYVTPEGLPGYAPGQAGPVPAQPFVDATFAELSAGDVAQLLSTSPDPNVRTIFRGRIEIRSKSPGSEPVVIRGLRSRTVIAGVPIEELRDCPMPREDRRGCAREGDQVAAGQDFVEQVLTSVTTSPPEGDKDLLSELLEAAPLPAGSFATAISPFPNARQLAEAACIDLIDVDGIVLEDLTFENCWISAVRVQSSRRITLKSSMVLGGTYGLAVKGARPDDSSRRAASDITVENVTWVQDVSGFENGDPRTGKCRADRIWKAGCPGDMWRVLPWGAVHHGAAEHFNGALLGGINISGDVVFRSNTVRNAFNGIRLTARSCSIALLPGEAERTECAYNARVRIYDNLFSYVRDNPVELKDWATDARIFHNRFHNSHAWLSLDGMGGGPVYIYGNRGWFDDRPTLRWSAAIEGATCARQETVGRDRHGDFDPVLDRRFNYTDGYGTGSGSMWSSRNGG
jgi:hypothetical protein